eukprot:COSAG02_NODE_1068_length_14812_cov_15.091342_5_plen_119_part_00
MWGSAHAAACMARARHARGRRSSLAAHPRVRLIYPAGATDALYCTSLGYLSKCLPRTCSALSKYLTCTYPGRPRRTDHGTSHARYRHSSIGTERAVQLTRGALTSVSSQAVGCPACAH